MTGMYQSAVRDKSIFCSFLGYTEIVPSIVMFVVCVSMLIFVGIIDVEKAPLMMSVAFALKYVLRYYLCVI